MEKLPYEARFVNIIEIFFAQMLKTVNTNRNFFLVLFHDSISFNVQNVF